MRLRRPGEFAKSVTERRRGRIRIRKDGMKDNCEEVGGRRVSRDE